MKTKCARRAMAITMRKKMRIRSDWGVRMSEQGQRKGVQDGGKRRENEDIFNIGSVRFPRGQSGSVDKGEVETVFVFVVNKNGIC